MNRIHLFFGTVALLFIAIWAIERAVPKQDPFEAADLNKIVNLNEFAESEISRLKIRHASSVAKPYDLGLFGNSRILSMSKKDLDVGGCSVFNFALSGQSFRSSVVMIEKLAERGTLPKLSVISVDHFELQKFNNPVWLGAYDRWKHSLGDIKLSLFDHSILLKERLKIIWRTIYTESLAFKQHFEFRFFKRGLSQIFSLKQESFFTANNASIGYRKDGSYKDFFKVKKFLPLTKQKLQIIDSVLRSDLLRLTNAIKHTKNKLFIYESPLHSKTANKFINQPSAHAQNARNILLEFCRSQNIICYKAPQKIFSNDRGWRDASHPPTAILGKWIKDQMAVQLEYCQK
jgi:hypothetical protein